MLGLLFKSQNKTASRSELIILLHPVVANTQKQLARAQYNEEQRYYMQGDLAGQLYPPGHPVPASAARKRCARRFE